MTPPPDGFPPNWRPFSQLSIAELETVVASRRHDPGTLAAVLYELRRRSGLPKQVALMKRIEDMLSQPESSRALAAQSGEVRRVGAGTQHSLPAGTASVRILQGETVRSAPESAVPRDLTPREPIPEWVRTVLIGAAAVLLYKWLIQ